MGRRHGKCWQSHLIAPPVSNGNPQAIGVTVMLGHAELGMIIGQVKYLRLLRGPGDIEGFFIVIVSLREGLEYSNLVPFNDDIKFQQKSVGKVLVIKIDIL